MMDDDIARIQLTGGRPVDDEHEEVHDLHVEFSPQDRLAGVEEGRPVGQESRAPNHRQDCEEDRSCACRSNIGPGDSCHAVVLIQVPPVAHADLPQGVVVGDV